MDLIASECFLVSSEKCDTLIELFALFQNALDREYAVIAFIDALLVFLRERRFLRRKLIDAVQDYSF